LQRHDSLKCSRYKCAGWFHELPEGICSQYQNSTDTYHLRHCNKDQICDLAANPANATCIDVFPPHKYKRQISYPGEPCSDDVKCYNSKCVDGYCMGKKPGESCLEHSDCNVGLICFAKSCYYPIPDYDSGCKSDFDCGMGSLCLQTTSPHDCRPYFSVPYGDLVNDAREYNEVSLTCYKNAAYPLVLPCASDND
jgi:hypothetical protein